RLPHARPRRDDHEVARLEARREPVEVAEAGRHSRDLLARLVEGRDPLEALLEQRLDVAEVGGDSTLRELEERLLGPVEELGHLAIPVPPEPRDLLSDAAEPTQQGHLPDDAGV